MIEQAAYILIAIGAFILIVVGTASKAAFRQVIGFLFLLFAIGGILLELVSWYSWKKPDDASGHARLVARVVIDVVCFEILPCAVVLFFTVLISLLATLGHTGPSAERCLCNCMQCW